MAPIACTIRPAAPPRTRGSLPAGSATSRAAGLRTGRQPRRAAAMMITTWTESTTASPAADAVTDTGEADTRDADTRDADIVAANPGEADTGATTSARFRPSSSQASSRHLSR